MILKQFMDRDFGKRVQRENLDKSRQICINAELLSRDGHSEIYADRGPQLQTNRRLGGAVKAARRGRFSEETSLRWLYFNELETQILGISSKFVKHARAALGVIGRVPSGVIRGFVT